MYKKKLVFIFLFFILNIKNLIADDKTYIIQKLNNTQSIKFSFKQTIRGALEEGKCIIVFPKKLKCEYENKKIIILKDDRLAIIQERYGKIQYYPVSKSPFIKILDKDELIKLINLSTLTKLKNQIQLSNSLQSGDNLIILFDKINYNLVGWKIRDQLNNDVEFLIKIKSKNINIEENEFDIPSFN